LVDVIRDRREPPVLLVCRFRPDALTPAREALRLLSEQPGCVEATLAQAIDEPDAWLLVARFDSVAAYRRALRPFPVREHVIPWLSSALPGEPATYEPRLDARAGEVTEHPSLLTVNDGVSPARGE
jgi:Antibiotic biosynthesis monooxygenase